MEIAPVATGKTSGILAAIGGKVQVQKRHQIATAIGATITVSIFTLLGLAASFGPQWVREFLKGPAANWGQAIGGVAAVFAAIYVGHVQVRAARDQEFQRRREQVEGRVETVRGLLAAALDVCEVVKSEENPLFPTLDDNAEFWTDCKHRLERLDPFVLPTARLVMLLTGTPRQLQKLVDAHVAYREGAGHSHHRHLRDEFRRQLNRTIELLTAASEECEHAVTRITGRPPEEGACGGK